MPYLRALPPAPMPEYANYRSKVRRWSTIQVAGRSYSVPSRLIDKEVQIRLYADWVEVYYKGHLVERMARVHGDGEVNVNYRHVIGSLVRKPGAFARYRFREQLFPTMHFRLAYDALREWRGERADVEYVRILHLAAHHHGSHGGQRAAVAAGSGSALRLRRGAGAGQLRLLLLDDLGYQPQGTEESEVLFTLIAERYERRSLGITSNLVFSEWERIFANPMATAAAIDRVVHHSVILEFDVPSYRTDAAQQRGQTEEVNRQN